MEVSRDCSTSTVCLFIRHIDCEDDESQGYSLVGVDISNEGGGWEAKNPRLLVQVVDRERVGMICAKCANKFYFLGGVAVYDDDETPNECPTDVLVYDITGPDNPAKNPFHRTTKIASMNSGKIYPISFEVNGKLYVLGSRQPWLYPSDFDDEHYCVFEVYDPETNHWTVLPEPPVYLLPYMLPSSPSYGFTWFHCNVINPQKVLICCSSKELLAYDTVHETWATLNGDWSSLSLHPLFVKDCFYRCYERATVRRIGPCHFPVNMENRFHVPDPCEEDIDWGSSRLKRNEYRTRICHLGDCYFCVIEIGKNRRPAFSFHLNLIIHKELRENEDGFKFKFLHEASFNFTTNFSYVMLQVTHVIPGGVGDCIEAYPEGKNKDIDVDFSNILINLQEGETE